MNHSVSYNEVQYPISPGETVLECLERHGVQIVSSCRSGVCQSCLMRCDEGAIPPKAQQGLKDNEKAQGYFLACVCAPESSLRVAMPSDAINFNSTVLESWDAGAAVRIIRLGIPDGFNWFAGQYLTVFRPDGVARSYSIASGPSDGYMELHVRRIAGGLISNWLHDDVRAGDALTFRGPLGQCFYTEGDEDAPLLLAGTGTGLAPLYGIAREAIRLGHRGQITLVHGAVEEAGLYHREELDLLHRKQLIEYHACVLRGDETQKVIVGALDEFVLSRELDLKRTRAFLCGDPTIVEKLRKKLFLKGMSNRRILADAFVPSAQGNR